MHAWATEGWDGTRVFSNTWTGQFAVKNFAAFMVLDITFGLLHYPEHVDLLAGWIHHTIYLMLVWRLSSWGVPCIFQVFAFDEIPTFIL